MLKKLSMIVVMIGIFGSLSNATAGDPDIDRLLDGRVPNSPVKPNTGRPPVTGGDHIMNLLDGNVPSTSMGPIVVDEGTITINLTGLPGKNDRVKATIKGFKSDADEKKVRKALWIAMNRFYKSQILDNAATHARRHREKTKDSDGNEWSVTFDSTKEARESLNFAAFGFMRHWGLNPKGRRFNIEISGADLGKSTGRAAVAITKAGNCPSFSIELNRNIISDRTVDGTAGTIFHEMLHNIGWRHGTSGKGYEIDYAKYLITEWGRGIARNGQESFRLIEDPYAHWDQ